MSNRPPLMMPQRNAPPPPPGTAPAVPQEFAEVLGAYPLPWVVGPFDATDETYMIFVKGDVAPVTDESRMNEHGAVFNGWIAMVPKPRMVVSLGLPKVMCELFVFAANKLQR